jgi:hypothetical protein
LGLPNFFVPLDQDIYEKKVRYIMEAFETQRAKQRFEKETFLSLMRLRGMERVAAMLRASFAANLWYELHLCQGLLTHLGD